MPKPDDSTLCSPGSPTCHDVNVARPVTGSLNAIPSVGVMLPPFVDVIRKCTRAPPTGRSLASVTSTAGGIGTALFGSTLCTAPVRIAILAGSANWKSENVGVSPPPPTSSIAVAAYNGRTARSEEHTSELQSLAYLVCRLLLEKKKT